MFPPEHIWGRHYYIYLSNIRVRRPPTLCTAFQSVCNIFVTLPIKLYLYVLQRADKIEDFQMFCVLVANSLWPTAGPRADGLESLL